MQITTSGKMVPVFQWLNSYALEKYSAENKNYIFDKKHMAVYNIVSRWKNNSKGFKCSNNETLVLKFDTNLSTDFVFEDIEFTSGRSITIALERSIQRDIGDTRLILSVRYINEKQEIFENEEFLSCTTVPGTIAKRLEIYKSAFDNGAKMIYEKYKKEGFRVNLRHDIENFANYLYSENRRRQKIDKFLMEVEARVDINKILILFSIFNNDCFWKNVSSFVSSLICTPYDERLNASFESVQSIPGGLKLEYIDELNRIISIKKSMKGLDSLFNKYDVNFKFHYEEFKNEFMALYSDQHF